MPKQPVVEIRRGDFVKRVSGVRGHLGGVLCVVRRERPAVEFDDEAIAAGAMSMPFPPGAAQKQRYSVASISRAGSLLSEYQIV